MVNNPEITLNKKKIWVFYNKFSQSSQMFFHSKLKKRWILAIMDKSKFYILF